MNNFYSVITTIQEPTKSVRVLASALLGAQSNLIVVGDRKGPEHFDLSDVDGFKQDRLQFLSLDEQQELGFDLAARLPFNHYSRKNLGYLQAMMGYAKCIFETDDDNEPLSGWQPRCETVKAVEAESSNWMNAYRYFSNHLIWPRGFPLDEVRNERPLGDILASSQIEVVAPIQQGLANGSPDVDAVWRLVLDRSIDFEPGLSICVPSGSWCPFNSQSTWWWPQAYPLMYLPSYCSFRMTDIWRSFIAQRCLWELGYGVVFHAPEVVQERNKHNLMRDFSDEVEGYLRNKEMVFVLSEIELKPGDGYQAENLLRCYEVLVARQFFPEKELALVNSWLADIAKLGGGASG